MNKRSRKAEKFAIGTAGSLAQEFFASCVGCYPYPFTGSGQIHVHEIEQNLVEFVEWDRER